MKTNFLRAVPVITLIIVFFSCNACDYYLDQVIGNGQITEEFRSLKKFTGIQAGGSFDIMLVQGDEPSLIIEADENLMDFIRTEVVGQTLKLSTEARFLNISKLKVTIVFDQLNDIRLSGAARLRTADPLQSRNIDLRMSGASTASIELYAGDLDARLSGASKLQLVGKVEELEGRLSGSSRLQAYDTELEECSLRTSGASKAEVLVTEELDFRGSGSSTVYYKGSPSKISTKTSGASSVVKR